MPVITLSAIALFLLKKGLFMSLISSLFKADSLRSKIAGIIFVICLSGLTLFGVYKVVSNYFNMSASIKQYEQSIDSLNTEITKLKESEKASRDTVRNLNNKLKNYQATRVKEKNVVTDRLTAINNSDDTDIVKTNKKLDVYYDDIYLTYCKLDANNCEVKK